jgi:DNA-binding NarL/FixJ family response regulator
MSSHPREGGGREPSAASLWSRGAKARIVGRLAARYRDAACSCGQAVAGEVIDEALKRGIPGSVIQAAIIEPGMSDAIEAERARTTSVRRSKEDDVSEVPPSHAPPKRDSLLTPRQTQVLAGLAEGKSTEQIAAELVLSPVTIRNHVASILVALGVHSRLEAVVTARRWSLIE